MTISYKVLGQSNPTSNVSNTVYTVPASNSAVISTVVLCNQGANSSSFKLAVVPSGNTISSKHYLNYNTPIPGNDSIAVTIGITLAANDSISINVSSNDISASVFGSEIY